MSPEVVQLLEVALRIAASLVLLALGAFMVAKGASNVTRYAKVVPGSGTRNAFVSAIRTLLIVFIFFVPGWAVTVLGIIIAYRNV